ncbi:hypothetical protein EIP91_001699 [Steccherinum ochraceum]|uniref:F-box domain-containing protein n=1 Tax=Steccherinum ochraceum TaxID=92696 RepID=A0A4R0RJS0_9APHY|nr:hypothetical protein EIP91_001699 [Steccherinum ochraceum]
MAPFHISSLPPELLLSIFSFACVDNGQTGCVISSICKVFRSLCLDTGADLQFTALRGTVNMKKFLNMLRRRDERGRRVVSLLLRRDEQQHGNTKEYVLLLSIILRTISPLSLRTLYISYPYPSFTIFSSLVDVSLPSVVELRIWGPAEDYNSCSPSTTTTTELESTQTPTPDLGAELARIFPRVVSLGLEVNSRDNHRQAFELFLRSYCQIDSQTLVDSGIDIPSLRSHPLFLADPNPLDAQIPSSLLRLTVYLSPFTPMASESANAARVAKALFTVFKLEFETLEMRAKLASLSRFETLLMSTSKEDREDVILRHSQSIRQLRCPWSSSRADTASGEGTEEHGLDQTEEVVREWREESEKWLG